jgi:hypothetical protein
MVAQGVAAGTSTPPRNVRDRTRQAKPPFWEGRLSGKAIGMEEPGVGDDFSAAALWRLRFRVRGKPTGTSGKLANAREPADSPTPQKVNICEHHQV